MKIPSSKPRNQAPAGLATAPSPAARILIAIDATAAYQRQMLRGIIAYAREHHLTWEFLFNHRPEALDFKIRLHRQIDGVLLHDAFLPTMSAASAQLLIKTSAPAVLIEHQSDYFPMVLSDSVAIGRMAFEYFKNKGFQNYAYFERTGFWVFDERRQAFESAVLRDNRRLLRPPPQLMDFSRPPAAIEMELGHWLATAPKPLGLFVGAIIPARQAASACRQMGIIVPDEVAILGVGHDEIDCEMVLPPLSAIDQGMQRAGYEAASLLQRLMKGQTPPRLPILVPPVAVVERQSTDVLAVEDADVRKAVRWIRDHALAGDGVPEMLRQIPLGRRRLEIAFRRHLGRSIHEEILRVRVENAKYLLRNSQMSMPLIAAHCGFNYASRLIEAFKRNTGMTPARFRIQSGHGEMARP
ncbi:MAG: substrate-binding domain-containing protein [Phycisphaerales bacterium]|nr:substrate-binding domain-containing protein [Phycisphaerales bacterium]